MPVAVIIGTPGEVLQVLLGLEAHSAQNVQQDGSSQRGTGRGSCCSGSTLSGRDGTVACVPGLRPLFDTSAQDSQVSSMFGLRGAVGACAGIPARHPPKEEEEVLRGLCGGVPASTSKEGQEEEELKEEKAFRGLCAGVPASTLGKVQEEEGHGQLKSDTAHGGQGGDCSITHPVKFEEGVAEAEGRSPTALSSGHAVVPHSGVQFSDLGGPCGGGFLLNSSRGKAIDHQEAVKAFAEQWQCSLPEFYCIADAEAVDEAVRASDHNSLEMESIESGNAGDTDVGAVKAPKGRVLKAIPSDSTTASISPLGTGHLDSKEFLCDFAATDDEFDDDPLDPEFEREADEFFVAERDELLNSAHTLSDLQLDRLHMLNVLLRNFIPANDTHEVCQPCRGTTFP